MIKKYVEQLCKIKATKEILRDEKKVFFFYFHLFCKGKAEHVTDDFKKCFRDEVISLGW